MYMDWKILLLWSIRNGKSRRYLLYRLKFCYSPDCGLPSTVQILPRIPTNKHTFIISYFDSVVHIIIEITPR